MIVEYLRYALPAGAGAQFELDYAQAAAQLDASPHCLGYELARCVEQPDRYLLQIEWDSAEGHLQGFRGSPGFRDFLAPIRRYIEAIEEMRHYERTGVRSARD